jgi:hypothetical protein
MTFHFLPELSARQIKSFKSIAPGVRAANGLRWADLDTDGRGTRHLFGQGHYESVRLLLPDEWVGAAEQRDGLDRLRQAVRADAEAEVRHAEFEIRVFFPQRAAGQLFQFAIHHFALAGNFPGAAAVDAFAVLQRIQTPTSFNIFRLPSSSEPSGNSEMQMAALPSRAAASMM